MVLICRVVIEYNSALVINLICYYGIDCQLNPPPPPPPEQNGRHFADDIFKYIFVNEIFCILIKISRTVYSKKYAHGFCFAVLCCGYTLTDFPISIKLTSLPLWQSNDCPSASKATLMNMDKCFIWIHYERLHNDDKTKHNKTVCIFLLIYCKCVPKGQVKNISALVQIMIWRRIGDRPLSESILTQFIDAYMRHYGEMS